MYKEHMEGIFCLRAMLLRIVLNSGARESLQLGKACAPSVYIVSIYCMEKKEISAWQNLLLVKRKAERWLKYVAVKRKDKR